MDFILNVMKLPIDLTKDVVTGGFYNSIKEINKTNSTITPFATLDRLIKIAEDTD